MDEGSGELSSRHRRRDDLVDGNFQFHEAFGGLNGLAGTCERSIEFIRYLQCVI